MKEHFNIERLMFRLFVISFSLLLAVQLAMTNENMRNLLTPGSDLDGRALEVNEFLYNEGKLRLQLIGIEASDQLKVTINGEVVALFTTNIIEVSVKDGDVLGVQCMGTKYKGEIEIVSRSPNVITDCVGKRFKTDGDPKGTLRIRVGNR